MNRHRKDKEKLKKLRQAHIERAREKLRPKPNEPCWGIIDTEYKEGTLWMGTDKGPFKYADEDVAKLTAQTIGYMLGWASNRCRARIYDREADTLKDSFDVQVPAEQVLKDMEEGRII